MAKVFLICGKIGSGKTTYAHRLLEKEAAVLLSCDEITLALFDQHIGEKHDEMVERTQKYLFSKAAEILKSGISVILDWGFLTRRERDEARAFFSSLGAEIKWHYIRVTQETLSENLRRRNERVAAGDMSAYYIDENIAKKFEGCFQEPGEDEPMVIFDNHPYDEP